MKKLDFIAAEKEANRNIVEEPLLIQPNKATVNLSKCYVDLKTRYDKAMELLLILNKDSSLNYIDLNDPQNAQLKQLHNDIIELFGEDWDIRILGYKEII